MKIVFDTNVLIAAFITKGVCSELLDHCIRHHHIITSEFILNEFKFQLRKKFNYQDYDIEEAINLLRQKVICINPKSINKQVCRDITDDIILGTAVAGNASCVITGDKDLLVLRQYESIDIISPGEFSIYEASNN